MRIPVVFCPPPDWDFDPLFFLIWLLRNNSPPPVQAGWQAGCGVAVCGLAGWLVGWLAGCWLAGWLAGWLKGKAFGFDY